jgi:hypothetical protein
MATRGTKKLPKDKKGRPKYGFPGRANTSLIKETMETLTKQTYGGKRPAKKKRRRVYGSMKNKD